MQKRKSQIAFTGNALSNAETWISKLLISANQMADQIMIDSAVDNSLHAAYKNVDDRFGVPIPQAELMASHYGSFGYKNAGGISARTSQCLPYAKRYNSGGVMQRDETPLSDMAEPVVDDLSSDDDSQIVPPKTPSSEQLLVRICEVMNSTCCSAKEILVSRFLSCRRTRLLSGGGKKTESPVRLTTKGAFSSEWRVGLALTLLLQE